MRSATIRRISVVAVSLALITGPLISQSSAATSAANTAASAKDVGGLDELIKLAKAEGELNVIALPLDWANYGEVMTAFFKKYRININSMTPDASSADEINAVKTLKGQNRQPDVVDVGLQYAIQGQTEGLFAPYQVLTWNDIPANAKASDSSWYFDYGGYVAIGYDAKKVKPAPTSMKSLLNKAYKNKVALNGDPTKANAAFSAIMAASVANGGSLDDVSKGLDFFSKLKKAGNFVPIEATPSTVQNGQTPITLDWDYLQATYASQSKGRVDWKYVIPTDVAYGNFYVQAIVKDSPHPAAARLWQEFLYSDEGQNLFLKGGSVPIRLPAMQKKGTANKAYLKKLPTLPKNAKPVFATPAQILKGKEAVLAGWSKI